MKITHNPSRILTFVSLTCLFFSCEKPTQELVPAPPPRLKSEDSLDHEKLLRVQEKAQAQNVKDLNSTDITLSDFKYVGLPKYLGLSVPAETMKRLEIEGHYMTELQNVPIQGARPVAIDLHGQVKAVVYVKDNYLVALGYLLALPVTPEDAALEAKLLKEYKLMKTEAHEALGSEFETVKIAVQKYENQIRRRICAVGHDQGHSRTVAFYDSTAVDFEKMLPSAPETIRKENIDKMKSEVERMKAILEEAKQNAKGK